MPVKRTSKNRKSPNSKSQKRMRGGVGAADHAISVFGGPGAQHAVAGSNVIAMKDVDAVVLAPKTTGGKKGRKQRGGKPMLNADGTPMLDMNGTPMDDGEVEATIVEAPAAAPTETSVPDAMKEENVEAAVSEEPVAIVTSTETPAVVQTTEVPKSMGGGILTEVAVPAVLLYANQTFRPKSRKMLKKGGKKARSSKNRK